MENTSVENVKRKEEGQSLGSFLLFLMCLPLILYILPLIALVLIVLAVFGALFRQR